jgi:hypothetical protein
MSFYYIVTFTKAAGIQNIYNYSHPNIVPLAGEDLTRFAQNIISIEGPLMATLNESLTACFNQQYGYTTFADLTPTDNMEYDLVFHYEQASNTLNLIFSLSFTLNTDLETPRLEIWNVCKSNFAIPDQGQTFRVYNVMNAVVKYAMVATGINIVWLGVLFANTYYENAVRSYLRAGFEIKHVTSLSLQYTPDLYNRILVMEAYNNKGLFATPPIPITPERVEELVVIAKRIQSVESGSIKQTDVLLQSSGWKLLLQKVISKNTECAGIINEDIAADGITKLITANDILVGCEGTVCGTSQMFPHEVNFHTHPIACYINYYGADSPTAYIAPPSSTDLGTILYQSGNKLKYHCIVTLEGIYVVQVHPYWKATLPTFGTACIDVLYTIMREITYPDVYFKDIVEALKWLNNSLSPNLLIKDRLKKEQNPVFIQRLHEFKSTCVAEDINRNINLYMCSFVQWPLSGHITSTVTLSTYMYEMKQYKMSLEAGSLNFKKASINRFLTNDLLDQPISLPYYEFI